MAQDIVTVRFNNEPFATDLKAGVTINAGGGVVEHSVDKDFERDILAVGTATQWQGSAGATTSGGVCTLTGGGAGFGQSIRMSQANSGLADTNLVTVTIDIAQMNGAAKIEIWADDSTAPTDENSGLFTTAGTFTYTTTISGAFEFVVYNTGSTSAGNEALINSVSVTTTQAPTKTFDFLTATKTGNDVQYDGGVGWSPLLEFGDTPVFHYNGLVGDYNDGALKGKLPTDDLSEWVGIDTAVVDAPLPWVKTANPHIAARRFLGDANGLEISSDASSPAVDLLNSLSPGLKCEVTYEYSAKAGAGNARLRLGTLNQALSALVDTPTVINPDCDGTDLRLDLNSSDTTVKFKTLIIKQTTPVGTQTINLVNCEIPVGAITDPNGGEFIIDPTGGNTIVDPNPA